MKTSTLSVFLLILSFTFASAEPPKSGQSLGTITTSDGKTFANAKLAVIEPDGISILYADGGAKIPFTSLSPDLQVQFGYTADKSAAYAREQALLAQIDSLQQENAALRKRLNLAAVPLPSLPISKDQKPGQPTVAGFHAFFFELRSQSTLKNGRAAEGYPKYSGGAFAGMKPAQAMVAAQSQWESLPLDQKMAWEQKALAYGDPIAKEDALEAARASAPRVSTQGVSHATVTDQNGNTSQVQIISQ